MRPLELGRRDVPDLAVQSPLVEPVDIFGDGDLDIADRRPAALRPHRWVPDALALEQRVERFGHRVVIRIAFASNGSDGIGFGEALGVAVARYWTPRSLWWTSPVVSCPFRRRCQSPISSASSARSVRRLVDTCQPTTSLLNTSITNAA